MNTKTVKMYMVIGDATFGKGDSLRSGLELQSSTAGSQSRVLITWVPLTL